MSKVIIATIALVLVSLLSSAGLLVHAAPGDLTVWGYLPEYRLGGFNYEAAFQTGLTHLIYFSLEVDVKEGVPSALDRLPSKEQAREARLAADKVGGKIIMSLGGNSRSQGFPTAAKTKKSRRKFLKALDKILVEYQFDGVDYNWEYPRNEAEWKQWGHLLKESKEYLLMPDAEKQRMFTMDKSKLDAHRRNNYKNNIVTFTMYEDPNHYNIIKHFNLLEHADYVHCMSYDQVHDKNGEHSTWEFGVQGIDLAEKYSFNLKKFTLGVPFYGRHVKNGEPKTWYDVAETMAAKKDDSIDLLDDYYFNGRDMIRRKTQLCVDRKIGGVMIWEIAQDKQPMDSPISLMTALNEAAAPHILRTPIVRNGGGGGGGGGEKEDL